MTSHVKREKVFYICLKDYKKTMPLKEFVCMSLIRLMLFLGGCRYHYPMKLLKMQSSNFSEMCCICIIHEKCKDGLFTGVRILPMRKIVIEQILYRVISKLKDIKLMDIKLNFATYNFKLRKNSPLLSILAEAY